MECSAFNTDVSWCDIHFGGNNSNSSNITTTFRQPINLTFHLINPFKDQVPKIIFIAVYALVFLVCVFGNMIVLLVTVRNLRMHTRTNLLLANLAVADMCVGIFCVIPNMCNYLFLQWYLGQVMCKLYQFFESMNFTASMLLLEVIAMERYIAINHPLKAKRFFTRRKMVLAQFTVWFVSSIYNVPLLLIYDTIENSEENVTATYCYTSMHFNMEIYHIFTFVLWYLIPLFIMSSMYATIANTLWRSRLPFQMRHWAGCRTNLSVSRTNSSQSETQIHRSPASVRDGAGSSGSCHLTDTSVTASSCSDMPSTVKSVKSEQTTPIKANKVCRVLFKKQKDTSADIEKTIINFHKYFKPETNPNEDIYIRPSSCSPDFSTRRSIYGSSTNLKVPRYLQPPYSNSDQNLALRRDPSLKRDITLKENMTMKGSRTVLNDNSSHPLEHQTANINSGTHCSHPLQANRMSLQRTSRRRVVKLLIVVLFTFAVLVLPNHVRLLMAYFYPIDIYWAKYTGPICHILMYLNSAVNPVLYSLFSESFRRSLKELLFCLGFKFRRAKN